MTYTKATKLANGRKPDGTKPLLAVSTLWAIIEALETRIVGLEDEKEYMKNEIIECQSAEDSCEEV